jgi:uncharacterized protein
VPALATVGGGLDGSIPVKAGIGLRAPHQAELAATMPAVAWLEAHSENYFASGGAQRRYLEKLRSCYPLSLHGVGLSLGSVDALDLGHLDALRKLVQDMAPALVSEHLSWGSFDGRFANDLLPMPYTDESVRHLARRIDAVQDFLGRQILVENVSSYLEYSCSRLTEWEFVAAIVAESGCGLLLDVNNIYVAARNHAFDAERYIASLPVGCVQEIHLAGHVQVQVDLGGALLIDTHSEPVCNDVWLLYQAALRHFGPLPTLIEWDTNLPSIEVLIGEARKADRLLEQQHAIAA